MFTHCIELDKIYRQFENETAFMDVLDEMRLARCSEECFQFITRELSRPIRHNTNDNLVELCFTRMEEEYINACKLCSVEGQSYMFVSEDKGKLRLPIPMYS